LQLVVQDHHLPSAVAVCGSHKLFGPFANYGKLLRSSSAARYSLLTQRNGPNLSRPGLGAAWVHSIGASAVGSVAARSSSSLGSLAARLWQ
jgi:hypothetical protein